MSEDELRALEQRVAALEELMKPAPDTLEVQFDPAVISRAEAAKAIRARIATLSGVVQFDASEIEGMDLSDFKKLLRLKIDVMAEDVVRRFKERRGEDG